MLALHPCVVDAVWMAVEPLIPVHRPKPHPLGCHRRVGSASGSFGGGCLVVGVVAGHRGGSRLGEDPTFCRDF
jgi:transposase